MTAVFQANTLLRRDAKHLIPTIAGIDPADLQLPKRRREKWPSLLGLCMAIPAKPWPTGLVEPWATALACHLLLAVQQLGFDELYQTWLSESYGWQKSDLYWWTLAWLKRDAQLEHKITHEPGQLFTFDQL